MDFSKLTPAPWHATEFEGPHFLCIREINVANPTDIVFCALARNAFDIMMRRGWSVRQAGGGWYAIDAERVGIELATADDWPDPFTALVEAEKFYVANIESKDAANVQTP